MAYAIPSVSDFKSQFDRDFPYAVPAFGGAATLTVVGGVITAVTKTANGEGYLSSPKCTVRDRGTPAGAGAVITVSVAQGGLNAFAIGAAGAAYVDPVLDITGGAGDESDDSRVRDKDILRAIQNAQFNVNQALFCDQASFQYAFGYLAAHCLVQNLLTAGQGMRSRFNWLTASKAVADVSESFVIPDQVKKNPFLASLSKTGYGGRYLEIISPLLVGNMLATFRQTLP